MSLDTETIEIDCPKCGRITKKTIAWIKRHSDYNCECGEPIHLDAGQFRREIKEVDRAMKDLEKTFKDINKGMKLR